MIFISEQAGFANNKTRTVSVDRSVSGIKIVCDTSITGMMADLLCRATYSNNTQGYVRPTWAITSGGIYASIDEEGHLTIKPNARAYRKIFVANLIPKTTLTKLHAELCADIIFRH